VRLGTDSGVTTVALLTDMSTPLGLAVGNANEVAESVEVLAGGGPSDVVELTLALAREMLAAAGVDADPEKVLASGAAMDTWKAMIRAQGGDPDAALPVAAHTEVLRAEADGVVTAMDAYGIGVAAWRLGAGRARKEDPVSFGAGVQLKVQPGDRVRSGDVLLELRTDDESRIGAARADAAAAITIGTDAPASAGLLLDRIA
jgi:thymidine phosphorylase